MSASRVPTCRQPLAPTGQETGIDLGLESFATLADGTRFTPALLSQGRATLEDGATQGGAPQEGQQPQAQGGQATGQGTPDGEAPAPGLPPQGGASTGAQYDTIYHEDLQTANMLKNHHLAKCIRMPGGAQFLSILAFKAACAGKSSRSRAAAYTSQTCSGCGVVVTKACPSAGTPARTAEQACIATTTPP